MQYNTNQYNTRQYNTDVFALVLTLADTVAFASSIAKSDAIFLIDSVSPSISNKGLTDTIEFDDWLSVLRRPVQSDWEG